MCWDDAGCEAAVYAMHSIFAENNTETVLNTFNMTNRKIFLHKTAFLCAATSTYVYNCYSIPSRMVVFGGCEIDSVEDTTLGYPIAMATYSVAVVATVYK